ncbi:MAG: hypothetical protein MK102_13415 [Fuerstiella sp.]|nr:hypothetical protein [Fuerstiella sp.]
MLTDVQPSSSVMRTVVERLSDSGEFDLAVEGIQAAIRNNQGQPWMYSVLPLEMRLAERPQQEIERALASQVDFAGGDLSQILIAASLSSRLKFWDQAMELCAEATRQDPWQSESWQIAKSIADRSGNKKHILWSRTGILRHVWTSDADQLHQEAELVIRDLLAAAKKSGQQSFSSQINDELTKALTWDLIITARWAGNADVDLAVNEPGDIICDRKNQITGNGGLLTRQSGVDKDRKTEEYRCQKAPKGDYEVVLRQIGGRLVTGNVVLQITRYRGTDREQTKRMLVPVGSKDGRVTIPLSRGRG